jgi:hypothetical protein
VSVYTHHAHCTGVVRACLLNYFSRVQRWYCAYIRRPGKLFTIDMYAKKKKYHILKRN